MINTTPPQKNMNWENIKKAMCLFGYIAFL